MFIFSESLTSTADSTQVPTDRGLEGYHRHITAIVMHLLELEYLVSHVKEYD
jgi:hypothetical protein